MSKKDERKKKQAKVQLAPSVSYTEIRHRFIHKILHTWYNFLQVSNLCLLKLALLKSHGKAPIFIYISPIDQFLNHTFALQAVYNAVCSLFLPLQCHAGYQISGKFSELNWIAWEILYIDFDMLQTLLLLCWWIKQEV